MDTQENKSPNAMVMSFVHTTKPGTIGRTNSFDKTSQGENNFKHTSSHNMFDRKLSEEDE